MSFLPKTAYRASKRFLPGVNSHVLFKSSFIVKLFITEITGMDELSHMFVFTHTSLMPIPANQLMTTNPQGC